MIRPWKCDRKIVLVVSFSINKCRIITTFFLYAAHSTFGYMFLHGEKYFHLLPFARLITFGPAFVWCTFGFFSCIEKSKFYPTTCGAD